MAVYSAIYNLGQKGLRILKPGVILRTTSSISHIISYPPPPTTKVDKPRVDIRHALFRLATVTGGEGGGGGGVCGGKKRGILSKIVAFMEQLLTTRKCRRGKFEM